MLDKYFVTEVYTQAILMYFYSNMLLLDEIGIKAILQFCPKYLIWKLKLIKKL